VNISRSYSSAVRDDAARATEHRIIDAAERLFLENGYGATTVTMIAAAAQVSKQTVYNSCGSKA
jgi:AcrR family transcriptional regulator